MLLIDTDNTGARLGIDELLRGARRGVSNPIAFAAFLAGWHPPADTLLDKRWSARGGAASNGQLFRRFLHQLLPEHYDVRHLERLGGRFALRLTGVGDFTTLALNRRVVTLSGLPRDGATGAAVIDVEIGGDVFLAVINGRLGDLATRVLRALAPGEAA
jgi:hypothetical protein